MDDCGENHAAELDRGRHPGRVIEPGKSAERLQGDPHRLLLAVEAHRPEYRPRQRRDVLCARQQRIMVVGGDVARAVPEVPQLVEPWRAAASIEGKDWVAWIQSLDRGSSRHERHV